MNLVIFFQQQLGPYVNPIKLRTETYWMPDEKLPEQSKIRANDVFHIPNNRRYIKPQRKIGLNI